ncbi:MAG: hypothetical protein RIC06_11765 [Cyclobacteriaceae bacterium]
MIENWDVFPVNIAETLGKIDRKPFDYEYVRTEVWRDGSKIFSGDTHFFPKYVSLNFLISLSSFQ